MQTGLKLAVIALLLGALGGPATGRALAQEPPDQLLPALAAVGRALDAASAPQPPSLSLLDESSGPPGPVRRNAAPPSNRADLPPTLTRAEAAFAAGQPRQALDALDAGPLPAELGDLVALRRAELAFDLGDRARSRAELARRELTESANRIVLIRAADLADRLGDRAAAAELWLRSVRYFSWIPERSHALESAALDFSGVGRPDRAIDALARLVDIGLALPDASKELASLASLGPYQAGLVAALGGDQSAAAQQFRRYLAEQPNGGYAEAARQQLASYEQSPVDAGWVAARDLNTVEAYRTWVAAYPSDPRVPEARFWEGFVQYRAGQLALALATWEPWTAPSVEVETRARALYWTGRAAETLGQPEMARQRWQTAAATRPSNYYAVRARDRLAGVLGWPDDGGALRQAAPTASEEAEVADWLAVWAGPARDPAPAEAAALRRAAVFAGLGLARTADAELYRLAANSDDPRVLYRTGRLAQESGSWMSALRAGLRLAAMSPGKSSLDAPVGVRLLSYPIAYRDEVQGAADRLGLGPILLLSVMRQESLFDRFAHSTAEARGLTQVIPSTGATVAGQLGRTSFQPEQLYDPAESIAFGSFHLADRLAMYHGDVFRTLASYNAGPEAVATWVPGVDDADVFVETIDYRETRNYVKLIYEYQGIYRSMMPAPRASG